MKFAAEYYFSLHLRSSHKETAHQCSMHMKSNHELVPTSDELKCLECNKSYQSKKDKLLHLVKVPG